MKNNVHKWMMIGLIITFSNSKVCAVVGHANLKQHSDLRGKEERAQQNKRLNKQNEQDTPNTYNDDAHTMTQVETMPSHIVSLYKTVGIKINIIDKNKAYDNKLEPFFKENPFFYDHEKKILHISPGDHLTSKEQGNILHQLGQCWLKERLLVDVAEVNKEVVQLLNDLQKEQRESQEKEDFCTMPVDQWLDSSFVTQRSSPFTEQDIDNYVEQIQQLYGQAFKYYYQNIQLQTVLKQASPVMYFYMKSLNDSVHQARFMEQNQTIQKKIEQKKIDKNNEDYYKCLEHCHPKVRRILQKYTELCVSDTNVVFFMFNGNKDNIKKTLVWIEKQENKIPLLHNKKRKLQKALQETMQLNRFIKQDEHKTEEEQTVFMHIPLQKWEYELGSKEVIERIQSYTGGQFVGPTVAKIIPFNEDKGVEIELIVPRGTYVVPLGNGTVLFPDSYGIEVMKEEDEKYELKYEEMDLVKNKKIKIKAKLVSGKKIQDQIHTAKETFINEVMVPNLREKKLNENILSQLNEIIHFDFTGRDPFYYVEQAKEILTRSLLLNNTFPPKFLEQLLCILNQEDEVAGLFVMHKKGVVFQSTPSYNSKSTDVLIVDSKSCKNVTVTGTAMRNLNPEEVAEGLDYMLRRVIYHQIFVAQSKQFEEKFLQCYMMEKNTQDIESETNEEIFFMEVMESLYDTDPLKKEEIKEEYPETARLIEQTIARIVSSLP